MAPTDPSPCSSARARRLSRRGGPLAAALAALPLLTLLPACARPPAPGEPIRVTRALGGLGDTAGRFVYPRCLDIAPDGGLWVIDRSARVQRLDPATGRCTGLFKTPEHDIGKPTGLFIGPGPGVNNAWTDTLLYIADTHYHRVLVYQPPPTPAELPDAGAPKLTPPLVRSVGAFGRGPGEFVFPTDVAVEYTADRSAIARIFVSEYGGNDRISIFDANWNFLSAFGAPGSSADAIQFSRPQSLALVGPPDKRRLVVVDLGNHRLGVFTLDGVLEKWIGSEAAATDRPTPALPDTINLPAQPAAGPAGIATLNQPVKFLYPMGVTALDDHTVLVTEFGAARIQHVDLDRGVCLGAWGRPGRADGELAAPWSAAVASTTIFALDSGNNRILTFTAPNVRRARPRRSGSTPSAQRRRGEGSAFTPSQREGAGGGVGSLPLSSPPAARAHAARPRRISGNSAISGPHNHFRRVPSPRAHTHAPPRPSAEGPND